MPVLTVDEPSTPPYPFARDRSLVVALLTRKVLLAQLSKAKLLFELGVCARTAIELAQKERGCNT